MLKIMFSFRLKKLSEFKLISYDQFEIVKVHRECFVEFMVLYG